MGEEVEEVDEEEKAAEEEKEHKEEEVKEKKKKTSMKVLFFNNNKDIKKHCDPTTLATHLQHSPVLLFLTDTGVGDPRRTVATHGGSDHCHKTWTGVRGGIL